MATSKKTVKRPYVICHMVATIDGKILTRRWKDLPAAKTVSGHYESTGAEFGVGSWLVGTATLKEFFGGKKALPTSKAKIPAGDFIAADGAGANTHAIALDAHGAVRFTENEIGGDHLVIIITEKVGDAYRAHLRKQGISYLVCGREKIDLSLMMAKLAGAFKLKKVLLEGGGVLNGAMLQAGLIDEISQIIVPIVDGGGPEITGLYDPPGKAPTKAAAQLKLTSQKTLSGGAQWLRFKVMK